MVCHHVLRARRRIAHPKVDVAHIECDTAPASIAKARRFVRNRLAGSPQGLVDDATLLVSELATNAVQHAHTGFIVAVAIGGGQALFVVADARADVMPVLQPMPLAAMDSETRRGLALMQLVARDYGCELLPDGAGKAIWFTLDVDAAIT